jgi:hypothetical protein
MRKTWRAIGVVAASAVIVLSQVAPAAAEGTSQPPGLDHFHCYPAGATTQAHFTPPASVELKDQFEDVTVAVGPAVRLCNPTQKTLPATGQTFPIQNPAAHLVCFSINEPNFQVKHVLAQNQFGDALLDVLAPRLLCLPSWKNLTSPTFPDPTAPPGLDHFKCYSVQYTLNSSGTPSNTFGLEPATVISQDEFGTKMPSLGAPKLLCNPVQKTRTDLPGGPQTTPVTNPDAHLVCFDARDDQRYPVTPFAKNQFGIAQLQGKTAGATGPVFAGDLLCLPSYKTPK